VQKYESQYKANMEQFQKDHPEAAAAKRVREIRQIRAAFPEDA
jgi:hypothetical protein